MRIQKAWVPIMAARVVETLLSRELVKLSAERAAVTQAAADLILDDLMVEDRLNDEVRQILKKHEAEIERGRLDYRSLFDLTKKKLARERNLIL